MHSLSPRTRTGPPNGKMANESVERLEIEGEGIYTGQIGAQTMLPHGTGMMDYSKVSKDFESYDGSWVYGCWHGPSGALKYKNGDRYFGSFEGNARHGHGLYCWADGRCYEGEFQRDERHGQGTFNFPDGSVYRGSFRHGKRCGQGTYTFPNGNKYTGGWKGGEYDGYGEFTWNDGRVYRGEWRRSNRHGKGIEFDSRGDVVHDGAWKNHKPVDADANLVTPPREIQVAESDDCSELQMSSAEEPRRRNGTPSSPQHMRVGVRLRPTNASGAARPFNIGSRPTEHIVEQGPNGGTRHVFRFGPSQNQQQQRLHPSLVPALPGTTNVLPARPQPLQSHAKIASQGESPAMAPFEGLPQINTLINDQRQELEKYNERIRRLKRQEKRKVGQKH